MDFRRLREARRKAGITQDELAEELNLNRATISKYESGLIEPSVSQFEAIAAALNVPVAELLEPSAAEKSNLLKIIQEIGLPHGLDHNGTVAEAKRLIQRVTEIYGEKSALLLKLVSAMSDEGENMVLEYARSIFQEYLDENIPREAPKPPEDG